MSKAKKKRSKQYRGTDAATPAVETVRHYTAVQRSPLGEWLHQRRTIIKRVAIIGGGGIIIIWLLIDAFRTLFG